MNFDCRSETQQRRAGVGLPWLTCRSDKTGRTIHCQIFTLEIYPLFPGNIFTKEKCSKASSLVEPSAFFVRRNMR